LITDTALTAFLLFLLSYTLSQFYRSFLAVIAPGLAAELSLGPDDLANMSAMFFGVFALAQFPLGVALDRIGPRRTTPALMLAAVAGALLFAHARTGLECIVAMGLIGLGCSPIYMGALYHFARTDTAQRLGFLAASLIGIGSLGNLLAATPLSLAVAQFGWRASFLGVAAVTMLSALLILALLRDPSPALAPNGSSDSATGSALYGIWQVLTIRGLWPLIPLLMLGYAAVVVERGLWIGPYFAEVHRLDTVALGNAALAMAIAMSAGALVFGVLDRRPGRRKWLVVCGSMLTATGFLTLGVLVEPPLWVAILCVTALGFTGLSIPLLTAHARMFLPEHLLGRGMTFANFLIIGGAGFLQWATGVYVQSLQAAGLAAPTVYARLHFAMATVILLSAAIYLAAKIPRATSEP
jgi:sugar phosphate permease